MNKIKYFYKNEYLLVYNIETLQLIKFRSNFKHILPKLLPENYTDIHKRFFLDKMQKINNENFKIYLEQLFNTNTFSEKFEENNETITISFAPTHKCNLKCKYCFANSGENYNKSEKEISIKVLEKIMEFIFCTYAPKCKNLQISLVSGGEPFLNLSVCTELDKIIKTYNEKINKKIFIATNGTIYNDHIRDNLVLINPQLGISIDGEKVIHNRTRIYQNLKGTYEDIIKNISIIKNDTNLSNKTKDFILMTVLNTENLDMVQTLKHHSNLGVSSVQFKIIRSNDKQMSINNENIHLFKEAYSKLSTFLIEEFSKKNLTYLQMITNNSDYFGKFIKALILCQPNVYRCGAGRDRFSFTADGSIYPCDSFVGNEEFLLGNIFDKFNYELQEKFYKLRIDELDSCKSCWIRYLCTGDCCFNSYIRTGSIKESDSVMCELFQFLAQLAIDLVTDMDEIDRKQFKKFSRLISIRERNNFIH